MLSSTVKQLEEFKTRVFKGKYVSPAYDKSANTLKDDSKQTDRWMDRWLDEYVAEWLNWQAIEKGCRDMAFCLCIAT